MDRHTDGRRWGEARYYSLDYYLKETFGKRLYKLALDGGMTCPNRDGTLGNRGCIFCSAGGSGEFTAGKFPAGEYAAGILSANEIAAGNFSAQTNDSDETHIVPANAPDDKAAGRRLSVTEQIEAAKALIAHKVKPSSTPSYIAYFQSYTNTYPPKGSDPVAYLDRIFREAISHPEVAVLSVATRPDCLPPAICELLAELNRIKPVWVELGFQTAREETARWMHRGYSNEVFADAVKRLHDLGIPVIAHLILGFPDETVEDMKETIRYVNSLPVQGIKFHLLHILKGTGLAEELPKLHVLSETEYIDALLACLAELSPDTVVHRITGDGPKDLLLAPLWSLDKKNVLNHIRHEMKVRDFWQGSHYGNHYHGMRYHSTFHSG